MLQDIQKRNDVKFSARIQLQKIVNHSVEDFDLKSIARILGATHRWLDS